MNIIYPGPMGSHAPIVSVRDTTGKALPIQMVHAFIMVVLGYAAARPDTSFRVQRDGWGYPWCDVVPAFAGAPGNVVLPV